MAEAVDDAFLHYIGVFPRVIQHHGAATERHSHWVETVGGQLLIRVTWSSANISGDIRG